MFVACGAPPTRAVVHVYCAETGGIGPDHRTLISSDDLGRHGDLRNARRREQYLTGRALLRFALERLTGRPARSHRLRTAHGGKLECIDGPAVSISHSGNLAVCAVSQAGCVGVDVQFPLYRRRTEAIAREYFAPGEAAWLETQPSDRFYMLWVLKEAFLKARGLGIGGGLATLCCRIEPPRITANAAASLALYSAGDAFLAVATAGCAFPDIAVECLNPAITADVLPSAVRRLACTSRETMIAY